MKDLENESLNESLVKLKDATIKENTVTGNFELCFKFEIDSSFEPQLKDYYPKFRNNLFPYITFTVLRIIEGILYESKSKLEVKNHEQI